jgi:bifunctional non-homologous end joining protein LigD
VGDKGERPRPKTKRKAVKKPAGWRGTVLPGRKARSAARSLPDFIPFATCLLADRPPNRPDWVEVELDGWRAQVRVEDGTPTIRTRNGHDYTSTFPEIAKAARGSDNCIIDGEICTVSKDSLTDFSALQAAMKGDKTDRLILFAFDHLFIGNEDLRSRHLMDRKGKLNQLLDANSDHAIIRFHDHLDAAGGDVIEIACTMKLEGIVSKRLSEPYVSDRTGIWTKAKCRKEQHAVVGGWTIGDKGFAGLLLGVYQGKKLIPIGPVGTGLPRKLVDWLEPRLKQLEIDASPFAGTVPYKSGCNIHWVKPQLVAGVEHTSWTNDGVLRLASCKGVYGRSDRKLQPDWISLPGE